MQPPAPGRIFGAGINMKNISLFGGEILPPHGRHLGSLKDQSWSK